MSEQRSTSDRIALGAFAAAAVGAAWAWGVLSVLQQWPPYPQIRDLVRESRATTSALLERAGLGMPLYYARQDGAQGVLPVARGGDGQGLTLVSHMVANAEEVVRIIDSDARVLHEWKIDWFSLWPDPVHLAEEVRPKTKPGTSIHGIVMLDNGDLVFNFENLGLIRVDYCGRVVWRLPYLTHHSVEVDGEGDLWVAGKRVHDQPVEGMPNFAPPFDEYTVVELSPTGEIRQEWSIYQILVDNGLRGLLHLSTRNNYGTRVTGDTLHLNDVEPFPAHLTPGLFGPGDVMISLRNINAVIVFNKDTRLIKYLRIGTFLRQHDPDFVDGNRISVFDNNNLSSATTEAPVVEEGLASRIVLIDARTGEQSVLYEGTPERPFFTNIMGKHQWISEDTLLIAGARTGRAFAVDTATREITWEYVNNVGDGLVGLIDDAQRLPARIDAAALEQFAQNCAALP